MPRACNVCQHEQRAAIDRDLAGNAAIPALAALYRVSSDSLLRHKQNHLPAAIAQAQAATEATRGDDLLDQVNKLKGKAISLLLAAERSGDLKTALRGVAEARNCLELLLEVEGQINRQPVVNLTLSVEWQQTRAIILHALLDHPEARQAVVGALSAAGGMS